MKKLLFFITTTFTFLIGNTQSNPLISTYKQDVDSLFLHLDKSGITTGILYDRVFPFSNLPFFNINPSQPDTIDFSFLVQASSELKRAGYTPNNLLPTADYFYTVAKQAASTDTVNLAVISYNYHYIDTAALEKGLIFISSTDSMLYDVPGRPSNPYILKQTTFAVPLDSALDYSKGSYTFTFNYSNYYSNHTKTVNRLIINFGDGGGDKIFYTSGSTYSPSYFGDGEKIGRVVVEFTDSTSSTNYFSLQVKNTYSQNLIGNPMPDETKSFLASRGFVGYDENVTRYAQANIGIYYADQSIGTAKRIKKPIIITDGIDFTQETKFEDLYKKYLVYNDQNNIQKSLIDELNLTGYDVIVVDYDDVTDKSVLVPSHATYKQPGADYVERNAMVVVDIIEWVNTELNSQGINEKLVIVGPSMGGLVTRYALRWMETNSLNHNCRLWVSFDAPHQGANIPIGSQYTLEFFAFYAGNEDAKKSVETKLNSPAAKEFLIHHYAANSVAQAGAPGFRDRFNTAMENLGWPQATGLRRVSLANGSLSGLLTNTPEAKSLEVEGKPSRFGGQVLVFLFHLGRERVVGTESYFTSNTYLSKRVFYGYRFKPFGASLYYSKIALTPSGSCSIDNSPGGIFDTQQQIADQIPPEVRSSRRGTRIGLKILTLVPTHSFIPTKSALGMYNYNNWCEDMSDRNLLCNNEVPFDNYFAPASSEGHVFLNEFNVAWIFKELDGGFKNCTVVCPPIAISGDNFFCNSVSNVYSIPNLPTGSIVHWDVSPSGWAFPTNADEQQTTITKTGNGSITLKAFITNSCTVIKPVAKEILIGKPNSTTGTYNSPSNSSETLVPVGHWDLTTYNEACIAFVTNISAPGATNVQWIGPSDGDVYWIQSGDNVYCSFSAVGQTIVLTLKATYSCGTVMKNYRFKCITTTNCGIQAQRVIIAPNPAKTNINVSLVQNTKASLQQSFQKVRIIDKMGSLKQNNQYNSGTKSASVNISILPPDVYTIQVFDGKEWYSGKFIKN